MSKRNVVYRVLVAAALAVLPVPAFAITQLIVFPAGDGVWQVQGNLVGVAGLQFSVAYDSSSLANPRVTTGSLVSGMMNAVNTTSNPIRFAFLRHDKNITSNGPIATITFDKTGSTIGTISVVDQKAINTANQNVAMLSPAVSNPSNTAVTADSGTTTTASGSGSGDTSKTTNPTNPTTTGTTGQPYVAGGSVTIPGDPLATSDKKDTPTQVAQENTERPAATEPTPASSEQPAAPADTQPATPPKQSQPPAPQPKKGVAEAAPVAQPTQSVLEKFRLFAGEKTVDNLTSLFNGNSGATISQSPAIAIADGKSTVKVLITKVPGDKAPKFTFSSARYVSVNKVGDGEWEVVAKPDKGAVRASITMVTNGVAEVIPLTVAPKAETAVTRSGRAEFDFQVFLNDRGTDSVPKFDLNGDGKRDYLDDYIYTANYLVNQRAAQAKTEKGNEKLTAEQDK